MTIDSYSYAHWYDLLWNRADAVPPELALLEPLAHAAGHVLDVGAGTGRLALALAEAGVTVTCLEPSPAMRAVFLAKLAQRPQLFPHITLLPGSITTTELPSSVGLAYLVGVLHHVLTTDELDAALAQLRRAIVPGGKLIIDSIAARPTATPLLPTLAGEAPIGTLVYRTTMWQEILAPPIHRWTFRYEILQGDALIERTDNVSIAREWLREEVERTLTRHGFALEAVYGNYRGELPADDSRNLVLVARREEEIDV